VEIGFVVLLVFAAIAPQDGITVRHLWMQFARLLLFPIQPRFMLSLIGTFEFCWWHE